ncbi:hypothetical protein ACIBEJ_11315 [Nonomuraea sp. NPDC050790]
MDLEWHRTGFIAEWERGEFGLSLAEVGDEQARQIIEHFREEWGRAV